MFLACRAGGVDWVIPVNFRTQFERHGYRMREAPAGLLEVASPTPLPEALAASSSSVSRSSSAATASSDSSPELAVAALPEADEADAPRRKRARR